MKPEEFLIMRPADFWLKLQGYREGRDEDFRNDAELTRLQTTELINIQLEISKRLRPKQLWRFPWEEQVAGDELVTEEENQKNLKGLIESLPKD
jgi:hypothetical protein